MFSTKACCSSDVGHDENPSTDVGELPRCGPEEALMALGINVDPMATKEIVQGWRKNPYYDRAELQDWLHTFWADDSPFRVKLGQLDLSCLVDLACGHGRHAAKIISDPRIPKPSRLTLLDVNIENIRYCKRRFAAVPMIEVQLNNGIDFSPLKNGSASAIFCWDAMVHFEFDCVISYVRDAFRVLKPNGRALFHHSNYTVPGSNWLDNPHGRNFMSRELFAHVAMRAGFQVVDQVILNWGTGDAHFHNLDCVSLLEKPADAEARAARTSLPRRVLSRLSRMRRGARSLR
jgi:SAM-dependent methyltransferase